MPSILEDVFLPLVMVVMALGIPLVAILVKHQQKMAMIYREDSMRNAQEQPQVASLRQEVDNLKANMNEHTILLDTIASQQAQILDSLRQKESIEQRLNAQ